MAEDALNMSLDDIIKQNSQKTQTERAKSRGGGRGRSASDGPKSFRGKRRDNGGEGRPVLPRAGDESLRVVVAGGVGKPARRGGAAGHGFSRGADNGGSRGFAPLTAPEPGPPRDEHALDGPGKWQHDMFDGGPRRRRSFSSRLAPDPSGSTLLVENLAYNVSQEDINELFETCGPLKHAELQYDRSGRSEGIAKVVFQNPVHAQKACDQYNNVSLDGQPMQITIHRPKPQSGQQLSSGIRVERPGGIRSRIGGGSNRVASYAFAQAVGRPGDRSRQRRPFVPNRGRGPPKSMAELDAELEDMMQG